jgi:NAD(P)-dependent dehydrogenase (short-subunit alcohol dehydrogenase family)
MTTQPIPSAILITGAGRRIGKAMALDLAEKGCAIAVHYHHSQDGALEVVQTIKDQGGHAVMVRADLLDAQEVSDLFSRAENELQRDIDVLVNNASLFEEDTIATFSPDNLDKHMRLHVHAPAILAQSMAMKNRQSDQMIINMIDQRVKALTPRFFTYTLSKSALWTMTQTLAQALCPYIRVNAIAPGPTLPNERQSNQDFQKQLDGVLLQKGAALHEFADTILTLWRLKSVTGQMIALDGGQHLGWQTPDIVGVKE